MNILYGSSIINATNNLSNHFLTVIKKYYTMFFLFPFFLEGRSSPKWTTSKSKDEYSSSLGFSIENKETREAQTTKIYNNPEERTHSLISTYSDNTLDQSVTTFSGPIDHHLQSKKREKIFGC